MPPIELLAPAKDLETGKAAINSGADAVYLGAARFGARENAANPLSAIQELAAYAHKYWARVYVTLNTLLFDNELEDAARLAHQVYQAGADALIIQDPGLLELDLPPLPLFASTQMHNHTPERVAFLEKVGFQRAILARELDLDQIREIRASTQIELETFIHGALCVSYSGQCYLSYTLGGRSGNRGQCAQPCRRRYSLLEKDGRPAAPSGYLLSLRDFNLSADLPDLLAAGVSSFKIEGRLKDQAYVMNVVAHYRRLLDAAMSARPGLRPAASGRVQLDFTPNPQKTFNRGFSTYFLHGRGAQVASPETPKSLGEPLGRVVSLDKSSFCLEAAAPQLHPGDGLCFLPGPDQELTGTLVNRVEGQRIFPESLDGLRLGLALYRNHDRQFSDAILKSQVARKIQLDLRLEPLAGGLRLTATDEDGVQAEHCLTLDLTPALQPEKARETIQRQLHKLGETQFECRILDLDRLDPIPFAPVSQLNALRRGLVEALVRVREQNRPRLQPRPLEDSQALYPVSQLSFEGNVLNRKAAEFYRRHGVTLIEPAAESGLDLRGRKVMTTKYCLRFQLNACPKQPNPVHLPEPLRLVDDQGLEFPLRFNCAACVMEVYFPPLG